MKLLKDSLFLTFRNGYVSLQVPDIVIDGPEEFVEVPDEWLIWVKDNIPCTKRESGFLYFTKIGYEANKAEIKEIFEASQRDPKTSRGRTWEEFEQYTETLFAEREKKCKNRLKFLKKKVQELEALCANHKINVE